VTAVVGRSCGSCTLCCKVLKILELNKPQGAWCQHCKPGAGCKIYTERPLECRTFHCGYQTQAELGEEWKPDRSKIVLVVEPEANRITAHVDPQRPDAWTREPFHTQLRQWAAAAAPHRGQVIATVGRRAFMIFPDRDTDLGLVDDDELIVTTERKTPFGVELVASKIHKDDPRAQNLVPHTPIP
jgi:hypothetical protein